MRTLQELKDEDFDEYYRLVTENKVPAEGTPRYENYIKFGYDVKFAYHVVRLMNEVEQILEEQDLDLERSREELKSIRRGEWKLEDIENKFKEKESGLQKLYESSKLRYSTDEEAIKQLLLDCLEQHFTSLSGAIVRPEKVQQALLQIEEICQGLRRTGEL